jgi:histidine triad (HIT) family protein
MKDKHQNYDNQNVFAKILRGQVPCEIFYQTDDMMSFYDSDPKAAIHLLCIPKGSYKDFSDFNACGSLKEKTGFWDGVAYVVKQLGLDVGGFRMIANQGKGGGQEVPHFHVHIMGGSPLGTLASS